jgi:hypothetical protein
MRRSLSTCQTMYGYKQNNSYLLLFLSPGWELLVFFLEEINTQTGHFKDYVKGKRWTAMFCLSTCTGTGCLLWEPATS